MEVQDPLTPSVGHATTEAPRNLVDLLEGHTRDEAHLTAHYGPALELVRRMLGTTPHAARYMAIWPAAFRAENLVVPNILNVPGSLFGFGAPLPLVGLAMYASSKAADCMYCTAHCCTFAMRRGLDDLSVARAIGAPDPEAMSAGELAALHTGAGMGSVPASLLPADVTALHGAVGPRNAEWIALGAAMMGFLNKCMDALGLDLERSVVDDVGHILAPTGWSTGRHDVGDDVSRNIPMTRDAMRNLLGWIRFFPGALSLETRWTRGVPQRWPEVGDWLQARWGFAPAVLGRIGPDRVRRALATMLHDNLQHTTLGPEVKHALTVLLGHAVGNPELAVASRPVAGPFAEAADALAHHTLDLEDPSALTATLRSLTRTYGLTKAQGTALLLGLGAASSPAVLPPPLLGLAGAHLAATELIEIVSWLGIQQCLHRAQVYYDARDAALA